MTWNPWGASSETFLTANREMGKAVRMHTHTLFPCPEPIPTATSRKSRCILALFCCGQVPQRGPVVWTMMPPSQLQSGTGVPMGPLQGPTVDNIHRPAKLAGTGDWAESALFSQNCHGGGQTGVDLAHSPVRVGRQKLEEVKAKATGRSCKSSSGMVDLETVALLPGI